MGKAAYPTKLLWMDMEMTGLDPMLDRILEVGVIVTDFEFKELEVYEAIVKQDDKTLDRMKQAPWFEWQGSHRVQTSTVYDLAKENGLLDKISDGMDEDQVEQDVMDIVHRYFKQPAVLAGNSIHQDRRFIRQWWKNLESMLHYRMLDVTSFKVVMQGIEGKEFQKPDSHRALEDIRGSIAELRYYLDQFSD